VTRPRAARGRATLARLLDRYEWTRNVGSWIDSELSLNPLYALAKHRYSTYSDGEVLDPTVLSLYLDVVSGAGVGWTMPNGSTAALRTVLEDPEVKCFRNDDAPATECVRYFVERYLERGSLYRPASDEQVDALHDFAQEVLADELGVGDRPATIMQIAAAAWMTSGALHRQELGSGAPDEHGRLRLSDWEFAQAITYALTRTPPGVPSVYRSSQAKFSRGTVDGDLAEFMAAAADGSIYDPEVVASLVRPYVSGLDEARRDLVLESGSTSKWANRGEYWMAFGVRDFFREWLDYADLLTQPPKVEVSATSAWSGFSVERSYQTTIFETQNIRENNLVTQLDDMIARIVTDDKDVLAQLLTSRKFYTPATAPHQDKYYGKEMNRVYNVQGITEETREARWIDLPPTERAGVLTHPAWLAAHSLFYPDKEVVDGHDLRHVSSPAADELLYELTSRGIGEMARMARALEARPEAGGTMLDNTVLLYLSDNGERHHSKAEEWAMLLLGGNNMGFKTDGRSVTYPRSGHPNNRQTSNLFNSLLHGVGAPTDDFGHNDPKTRTAPGPLKEIWA